jgi:hypothetical protein
MTEPVGPALARIRLSTYFRKLRHERPAAGVAKAMLWSVSKLNRIENNRVKIEPLEVRALAEHYGITDPAEVDRLVGLSLAARQRMWWREEHTPLSKVPTADEAYLEFIALENDAAHLYGYQSSFVPPLLQIPRYAEALTSSVIRKPIDDPAVRKLVDVRLRRQETLQSRLDSPRPPSVSLAIDESVLLRPVGSDEVMSAQLDHLLAMNDRPTVRLVVLPLRLGAHPGLGGPFELLTFPLATDPLVVFIETPASDFLLTDEEKTPTFLAIMDSLLRLDSEGRSLAEAVRHAREAAPW